ncbi:acyl-CoA thioesterase [Flammeovirga aprica]|uniref:Acyl-CoA thioesterase n=1 Tax=Flammeovirga aprica JL-4 TaxID=694437 RepID=A0A7X9NZ67_9BACT|nr:acyl-CoA thioesterase [Flammeovirga aprica]NME66518.1 acyl-CoA thioesterase [Flammeovirga aprica JL-4]
MKRNSTAEATELVNKTVFPVRFSEVDTMRIVWHGHYIKYMEEGREAFGLEHGISYMQMYEKGFMVPVVSVKCDYKQPLRYGDKIIVETTFVETRAAKLIYKFRLFRSSDNVLVATGKSIQVFITEDHELQLTFPEFFEEWKREKGLIK